MEYRVVRKLQDQGGSYLVALPKPWVKANRLKEGDFVTILFNGEVRIVPKRLDKRDVSNHGD
jgi:bifunctional DNA-binding transcriptional regulator/antitoxin component of YhaV-PrlF toxin-antitoxin module